MNDKEIKEYIVKNKGLIGQVALKVYRKYNGNLLDYDDFFQEGMIIAMKYLKTYNSKIAKATTYINDCCYKALTRYGELNTFTLKVPSWIGSKSKEYYKLKSELEKQYKKVTPERIGKYLGMSTTSAESLIKALEGTRTSYYDLNEDDSIHICTDRYDIENYVNSKLTIDYIKNKMKRLEPRDAYVLNKRIYTNETLEDIGKALGVCKERIRQIEQRAIKNMRYLIVRDIKNKEVSF